MSDQIEKRKFIKIISAIVIILIWAIFYYGNLSSVPFHPDESTQIFMSNDLELIFNDTSELIFQSSQSIGLKEKYRLLDAPIPKYLIGVSRIISGQNALIQDWDWSKSWSENLNALPSEELLFSSRLIISLLFFGSIFFMYLISTSIFPKNKIPVLVILTFFSFNALLLLHTRRAMAEGVLLFFLLLCLYSLYKLPPKWIWVSAIPISLAINAKQSLVFLVPIGIILIVFYHASKFKHILIQLTIFFSFLFASWYVLNPISWKEPITVAKMMITERRDLSSEQYNAIESVTPEFALKNVNEKIIALIAQSFVLPPAPQDVSNYEINLEISINNYFNNPLHKGLFRNLMIGTVLFLLTIWGFGCSFFIFPKKHWIIFSLSFALLTIEILVFINIPFQRYYLPMVPFVIIFSTVGFFHLINLINKRLPIKN